MSKKLFLAISFVCLFGCAPHGGQPASIMTEPQATPAAAPSCDMHGEKGCGGHEKCGCDHDAKKCECDHKCCAKSGCMHDKGKCDGGASCASKGGSCAGKGKKK